MCVVKDATDSWLTVLCFFIGPETVSLRFGSQQFGFLLQHLVDGCQLAEFSHVLPSGGNISLVSLCVPRFPYFIKIILYTEFRFPHVMSNFTPLEGKVTF